MTRLNQTALALCLAAATTACAGDTGPDAERRPDAAPVGTAGSAGNAAATPGTAGDRDFVHEMLAGGTAEVELGRLVQERSKNRDVREFAAMMIEDHTKAGNELKQIAAAADISAAPASAGRDAHDDHQELAERLEKLSGREFDAEYIKAMVDDHEAAVDAAEDKANDASSDHVKQWAAKALPTLKKHLERARKIQETLDARS